VAQRVVVVAQGNRRIKRVSVSSDAELGLLAGQAPVWSKPLNGAAAVIRKGGSFALLGVGEGEELRRAVPTAEEPVLRIVKIRNAQTASVGLRDPISG
jgi:hypothetical protein